MFVQNKSPAAMVGLRFGDQILDINGENVAGYNTDKVHDIIKKAAVNDIRIVVRDRPFERVITLHKDSAGNVGFTFKNGKISAIVKDSSAARNGLLTEHNFLEINGQNVVAMDDKSVRKLMESGGDVITLTIMPSFVFEHMMKQLSPFLSFYLILSLISYFQKTFEILIIKCNSSYHSIKRFNYLTINWQMSRCGVDCRPLLKLNDRLKR